MGLINFDARMVSPSVGIEPVPEGWYKTVVTKSNNKAVSTGNGGMLELILTIIEGQYQGRILYWNLNLFNTSEQAKDIAYKELSALCHVIGQYQIQDTTTPDMMVPALHNIPFMAHATIVTGNKGSINNIKAVRDINGNDPGKQGQGQGQPTGGPPQGQQPPQQYQQPPQGGPQYQPQPNQQPQPQQGNGQWQPSGAPPPGGGWQGGGQPANPAQGQPQGGPPPGNWQAPPNQPPNQPGNWQAPGGQPQNPPPPAGGWQGGGQPSAPPPQYQGQPQVPQGQPQGQQPAWQPPPGGAGGNSVPWNR